MRVGNLKLFLATLLMPFAFAQRWRIGQCGMPCLLLFPNQMEYGLIDSGDFSDFLIAFFSDGFPLEKAVAYAKLRKPFCINDLPMQQILWDRRLCLRILDHMGVPAPKRLEVNRDGGPRLASADIAQHVYNLTGVRLEGPEDGTGGGCPKNQKVI